MSWTPLAERFSTLPLLLVGPILRRVEPRAVTVWLALKEARTVTLRIYSQHTQGDLTQHLVGTRSTVRLGDHLHLVAVTARATEEARPLEWGDLYFYDLFFQSGELIDPHLPLTAAHLATPGILTLDPSSADPLQRLVYPGHPLPGFVLPPEDVDQLRIIHGSCRKPHGIGKEMLAALDSILETMLEDTSLQAQQLFLTGDQIYADDVAAPLLFALIDAGDFLFTGNEEEHLPLVNLPARALPPGGRGSTVRNRAMLTTTTPNNHLLSLAEYMTMYLFVWSDILWPDDLPEIDDIQQAYAHMQADDLLHEAAEQYADTLQKLRQFRSTLPQVRRILANIATYTICDDHDVTDDWYLDGAWCQQVLNSKLGHRVIRNALLAYALCQAWGNTPDQFDQPHSKAFLDAIDTWRGDEADNRTGIIAKQLGLPPSFDGGRQLPHTEQAFHWNYTYVGPHFQIIVLDTRTHRLYRAPSEFPGLLSPHGLATQVATAIRDDVAVTLVISATPVIGQNFVEAVQFWSHWSLRNNYRLDREAWALDWSTFQHLLRLLSAMKRVVILSGDVHYAFGSSLAYWSHTEKTTAKLVNYTSSPLLNEVSGPEIAVLATIYPQLAQLLRGQRTPQADFFAWDTDIAHRHLLENILHIIRARIFFIWWSLPKLIDASRSRTEIVLPAKGWPQGAFNAFPPDRSYRVSYLRDQLDPTQSQDIAQAKARSSHTTLPTWLLKLFRTALKGVTILQTRVGRTRKSIARRASGVVQAPTSHVRKHSVRTIIKGANLLEHNLEKPKQTLGEAIFHQQKWLHQWKAGTHIIGYANIGEIAFDWNQEEQEVIQRLWWWHPDDPTCPTLATEFRESLKPPELDERPLLP